MIRVRFAQPPLGHLSLGAARVALASFLHARRHNGEMLLRLDDTEAERCKPEYARSIVHDLEWLGIVPNETLHQSERFDVYADAIAWLKQTGRLYPCFESEEELRAKRDHRIRRGLAPVYDRAMLRLTQAQRAAAEAGGKMPYWRFRLSDAAMQWDDLVLGPRTVQLSSLSDPICIRADGTLLPRLTGVLDDLALGITHVIRGEEQANATAMELDLAAALDAPRTIGFGHLPALADDGNMPASRRAAGRTLRGLRNDGVEPAALVSYLARIGGATPPDLQPLETLAAEFDLSPLAAAPARFNAAQLLELNRAALRQLDFGSVSERLPRGATEAFWVAVRGSLDLLTEARGWWDVVAGTIVPPVIEGGRELFSVAGELLPEEPWNGSVCSDWLGAISRATRLDAGSLLPLLRLALTGEDGGPELHQLLPLMGRARAMNRLQVAAS